MHVIGIIVWHVHIIHSIQCLFFIGSGWRRISCSLTFPHTGQPCWIVVILPVGPPLMLWYITCYVIFVFSLCPNFCHSSVVWRVCYSLTFLSSRQPTIFRSFKLWIKNERMDLNKDVVRQNPDKKYSAEIVYKVELFVWSVYEKVHPDPSETGWKVIWLLQSYSEYNVPSKPNISSLSVFLSLKNNRSQLSRSRTYQFILE